MIILASNSPRRKQLLALTGWDYRVLAAQVDESPQPGEPPVAYVRRLAQEKARAALEGLPIAERSQVVVIAADTVVVLGSEVLGKPTDPVDAEVMLRRLRGCSHLVYTALCVLQPGDGAALSEVVATEVTMRDYTDDEIQAYIATGDPMDKAGAYAIQHSGFHPVQNLQGCYANVMGLPVCRLAVMLAKFGLQPENSIVQACETALDRPCEVFLQLVD